MKTALFTVALIMSQVSFAQIKNSGNEARHQSMIEAAIEKSCGKMLDLTQVAQKEIQVSIDNGITDIKYATLITGSARLDQMYFDKYEITVQSTKADMYDHSTGNWGAYSIDHVSCKQK